MLPFEVVFCILQTKAELEEDAVTQINQKLKLVQLQTACSPVLLVRHGFQLLQQVTRLDLTL